MTSFKEISRRTQEWPAERKQEQDSGMTSFKENRSRTQE